MFNMEFANRKSVWDNLKKYDHLANENDIIQVTEWVNGEGFIIEIGDKTTISLSEGELDAIIHLKNALDYEKDNFK